MPLPDLSRWHCAYECLSHLFRNHAPKSIAKVLVQTDEASYYAWTLSALAPWELVDELEHTGKGKPRPSFIVLAGREGIRAPNKLCDIVAAAHRNRAEILALKTAVAQKDSYINERDRFGMAIRQWDTRGGHWRLQVLFSLLVEVMQRWEVNTKSSS